MRVGVGVGVGVVWVCVGKLLIRFKRFVVGFPSHSCLYFAWRVPCAKRKNCSILFIREAGGEGMLVSISFRDSQFNYNLYMGLKGFRRNHVLFNKAALTFVEQPTFTFGALESPNGLVIRLWHKGTAAEVVTTLRAFVRAAF